MEEFLDIFIAIALFVVGLIIIVVAGNWLVSSAGKISKITGISEALIGATIVSLATTLPELNVVIFSAFDAKSGLAIGNSIGSIMFNLTFILGVVLLFTKNDLRKSIVSVNFYVMLVGIVLVYIFGVLNLVNKVFGMILLCVFLFFFVNNIIDASKKGQVIQKVSNKVIKVDYNPKKQSLLLVILIFCVSSFLVSFGAKLLVQNGERLAELFNVSEHIIGVTIIAIGTSLPEVVTAVSSIRQNCSAIAVGNTIGANTLSITLLLGINAIIEKDGIIFHENITKVAIPLILLSCFILYVPMLFEKRMYKLQGFALLVIFAAYYCTVIF